MSISDAKKEFLFLLLLLQLTINLMHRYFLGASLVAQMVKSLPAVQETRVQSLNLEDLLEKGMATNIVFLPREFHRQRILESHSTWDCKELDKTD